MAIMKPMMPTNRGITMWKNRSPVLSECLETKQSEPRRSYEQEQFYYLVTKKATIVAKAHGGAHNSNVTVVLNPSVLVNVGKKALKLKDTTIDVKAKASHQTFQSEKAIIKPLRWLRSVFSSSLTRILSNVLSFLMWSTETFERLSGSLQQQVCQSKALFWLYNESVWVESFLVQGLEGAWKESMYLSSIRFPCPYQWGSWRVRAATLAGSKGKNSVRNSFLNWTQLSKLSTSPGCRKTWSAYAKAWPDFI